MSRTIKSGVYQIRNLTNHKLYIGSTINLRRRWFNHQSDLVQNKHHSIKLQRAWNKYGADVFVFEVLLYCDPENCLTYEQTTMDYYQPEYNICKVARSRLGASMSTSAKEKLRQKRLGSKHTKATRIKMAQAHIGQKHSDISKNKIRVANRGSGSNHVKLNQDAVRQIRVLLQDGLTQNIIAKRFDVTQGVISRIKNKQAWSWLL